MSIASTIATYTVPLLESRLKREEMTHQAKEARETNKSEQSFGTGQFYARLAGNLLAAATGGVAGGLGKAWGASLFKKDDKSDKNDKNNDGTNHPIDNTKGPVKNRQREESELDKAVKQLNSYKPQKSKSNQVNKHPGVTMTQKLKYGLEVPTVPANGWLPAVGAGAGITTLPLLVF